MKKTTICSVADYVIVKLEEAGAGLNVLKLQKLLFYIQAWHLAIKQKPLFDAKFQAWVHGPVSREIYDRFSNTHMMYGAITSKDVAEHDQAESLDQEAADFVNEILEAYASYSGTKLERMTHDEEPWIQARGGLPNSARCETEIDEGLMASYYKQTLEVANSR